MALVRADTSAWILPAYSSSIRMSDPSVPPPLKSVLKGFNAKAARRAIYVDFEGRPWHPPVLLGQLDARILRGSIVDPAFGACAHRWGGKHIDCKNLLVVLDELLGPELDVRHIVSWSQHDYKIMMQVLGRAQQQALRHRYVNALAIVRPWYRKTHGQTSPAPYKLSNIREEFGLSVPTKFGDGVVGKTLAHLQGRFAAGVSYGELEPRERKAWVAVVKHNRYDLDHMREILIRVTSNA